MKNDKMIIPSNIHVGYQEREDTYTGKLALVIKIYNVYIYCE